jgi:diguanylate cyclase (GGDEF)-like protein/PAS domain S-box-containing protein
VLRARLAPEPRRDERHARFNALSAAASAAVVSSLLLQIMKLAAVLIPPSLDAKQVLRLRRCGLAAVGYALAMLLLALAWTFGALAARAVLQIAAAFVAINLGVYAIIRSGFNLRFEDPSLTRLQILAAITVLMYIVYHMDGGRDIALFACFFVFLFGVFRFNARDFTLVTLYTLATYALVIVLLMHLRPQAIQSVPGELMSWLGLAVFLPFFTVIGGQISALRRRLRESEVRFRSLTEMSSDFYWESDAEHRLARLSPGGKASGVPVFQQREQIGKRRWEMPYLSPDEAGWQAHRAALDARQPFRDFELSRLDSDGVERHISISGDPVFDASGAFKGYRGVGSDTTARKQAEQALRNSAEELRLFTDNVPAMTSSFDESLRCRFVNRRFAEFFGFTVENIIGKHLREVAGEKAYPEIEGHFAQVMRGHPVTYQRLRELTNGESRYLEVKLLPHISDQGKILGCFAVTTDITEHKLTEERMQQIAHHDSLTGLPNRLLFNDRLSQAISLAKRDSRQFALLYLDLDKFKAVNDTLGHTAGDQLLISVAARIRRQVRESDTVARVGGDEFTVILPEIARHEEAETVARKIIAALTAPYRLGSQKQRVEIGASIGVAVYPADARDADALVTAADSAMYSAKQALTSVRFFGA